MEVTVLSAAENLDVQSYQRFRGIKDPELQSYERSRGADYERSGVTELNIKDPELQLFAEIQNCNVIKES